MYRMQMLAALRVEPKVPLQIIAIQDKPPFPRPSAKELDVRSLCGEAELHTNNPTEGCSPSARPTLCPYTVHMNRARLVLDSGQPVVHGEISLLSQLEHISVALRTLSRLKLPNLFLAGLFILRVDCMTGKEYFFFHFNCCGAPARRWNSCTCSILIGFVASSLFSLGEKSLICLYVMHLPSPFEPSEDMSSTHYAVQFLSKQDSSTLAESGFTLCNVMGRLATVDDLPL